MAWWFQKWSPLLSPTCDSHGNYHLEIPLSDGSLSETLFTAHSDTVDYSTSSKTKTLGYLEDTQLLCLMQGSAGECLGADDGAGCEILCCLAEAGVPGYYLWTAQEEHGAIGISNLVASGTLDFSRFKRAIAFDRKDYADVINSQMGSECCSDDFALDLCERLGTKYYPAWGCFTDTAYLTHLVAECTNISVGYDGAHTQGETLDIGYLDDLIGRLKVLQWSTLLTSRVPAKRVSRYFPSDNNCGIPRKRDAYAVCLWEPRWVVQWLKSKGLSKELEDAYSETKDLKETTATKDWTESTPGYTSNGELDYDYWRDQGHGY